MMNAIVLALAITATFVMAAPPACNADNCLRAVIATNFPTRSGVADCSAYLVKTTTPAVVTTTITVTAVTSIALYSTPATTATNIPAYASPCSGVVRYTSACSCAGVTARTVTAATPTSTVVVTSTPGLTTCAGSNIKLIAVTGPYDGQYAQVLYSSDFAGSTIQFSNQVTDATLFNIDANNHLMPAGTDTYAYVVTNFDDSLVYFDTYASFSRYGNANWTTASIAPGNILTLTSPSGGTALQTCGNIFGTYSGVLLAHSLITDRGEDTTPCYLFSFKAVC